MVRPDVDMTRLTPGPIRNTAELTGVPASDGFAELPLDPERLAINKVNPTSPPSVAPAAPLQADGSLMRPNLNLSQRSDSEQGISLNRNRPHVMSWMEYDGDRGGVRSPKV